VMVEVAQQQQIFRNVPTALRTEHGVVNVRSPFARHVPLVAHPVGYAPPVSREYGLSYLTGHWATPGGLGPDRTPLHSCRPFAHRIDSMEQVESTRFAVYRH